MTPLLILLFGVPSANEWEPTCFMRRPPRLAVVWFMVSAMDTGSTACGYMTIGASLIFQGICNGRNRREGAIIFPILISALAAATLFCHDVKAQEVGCKDDFCWEVYPPRFKGGDTLLKITKWPKSTHRNIRWDCEAGGCQIEGDTLHLRTGASGSAHQVSIQACTRNKLRRATCSAWTSFMVY